jgi:hypothetical protein
MHLERVEADGAHPWSALTGVGLLNADGAGLAPVRPRGELERRRRLTPVRFGRGVHELGRAPHVDGAVGRIGAGVRCLAPPDRGSTFPLLLAVAE